MGKLRFYIALWGAKAAQLALRILRRKATHFPGKLAIRLCPDFIGRIGKPQTIIGVTGTNGKTTVCNMVEDILQENGYDLLHNRLGSNINAGIASALIAESSLGGKCKHQVGVFEIDERSSKLIYPYMQPDYLVITNLFRDSIRRNAHAEYIADIISSSVPASTKLILNADDLISARVAPNNPRVYFGIGRLPTDRTDCINIINDMPICPQCHTRLQYEYLRYHHIGRAFCPNCGFAAPDSDYLVQQVDFDDMSMTMREKDGQTYRYKLVSNSIFNIYNMTTVIALLREFGLAPEALETAFQHLRIMETRYSSEDIGKSRLVTHMAKGQNPIACSRVFEYVKDDPGEKELILILDDVFDAKDSSENITWLYDCDFEFLNDAHIRKIVLAGVRAKDYYLRLLIAGVPAEKLVCTRRELDAPALLDYTGPESIFILHELYSADLAFRLQDAVRAKLQEVEA